MRWEPGPWISGRSPRIDPLSLTVSCPAELGCSSSFAHGTPLKLWLELFSHLFCSKGIIAEARVQPPPLRVPQGHPPGAGLQRAQCPWVREGRPRM